MATMDGGVQNQPQQQQPLPAQQVVVAERLNQAVQQQLNLEALKNRATTLFKAISRILEDFDVYGRTNTTPKWSTFIFRIVSFCDIFQICLNLKFLIAFRLIEKLTLCC